MMTFLRVVWINFKAYGWIGFLVLAGVFAFFTVARHRNNTQTTIMDEIRLALTNKQKEVDDLRDAVRKTEEKKRLLQEAYEITLLRINSEKETSNTKLTEVQKLQVQELIDEGKTPNEVAAEVHTLLFGGVQ